MGRQNTGIRVDREKEDDEGEDLKERFGINLRDGNVWEHPCDMQGRVRVEDESAY